MSNADLLPQEDLVELTNKYMTAIYDGVSGYVNYKPGEKGDAEKNKVFYTYGEILPPSVTKIINTVHWQGGEVFYDFGSGVGKVSLHFFMDTPIQKSIGIEANTARYEDAVKIVEQVKKDLPDLFLKHRELRHICGNFLEQDISDATVIFICSTCFSEALMQDIGVLTNKKCPALKVIFTLKPIPNTHLPFLGSMKIDCTWDQSTCYVYGDSTYITFPEDASYELPTSSVKKSEKL